MKKLIYVKKLIYIVVVALGLCATIAVEEPWPPDCIPNCPPSN